MTEKGYRRLARRLWRSRAGRERETADEIESHIEMRVEDLVPPPDRGSHDGNRIRRYG